VARRNFEKKKKKKKNIVEEQTNLIAGQIEMRQAREVIGSFNLSEVVIGLLKFKTIKLLFHALTRLRERRRRPSSPSMTSMAFEARLRWRRDVQRASPRPISPM
jgi:Rps23 Pro-64 3,4-dihydroxylase Tpa1-like proline 4-hydroxylase